MKIRALAVAAAAFAWGCGQQISTYTSASGSLALSSDDALLYAVDSDSDQLFVIDAKDESTLAQIKVGHTPEKVIVGPDDTIYVSNRMDRSVSVIHRGDWKEAIRLATAVEPTGMAFSADGKTLLVVNATMLDNAAVGSLMGFDAASLVKQFEIPVGAEPRAVAVIGNSAFVSLYKAGDVATVDLVAHKVLNGSTDVTVKLNTVSGETGNGPTTGVDLPAGGAGFNSNGFIPKFSVLPHGVEALTATPDGKQIIASTLLSSNQELPSDSSGGTNINPGGGSGADGYGSDTCGSGAVAMPALLSFDSNGNSQATAISTCQGQHTAGLPAQVLVSGNATMPIQGPSATTVDPTGVFLFVVGRSSNNVAILPVNSGIDTTNSGDVTVSNNPNLPQGGNFQTSSFGTGTVNTTVAVGAGPSGIALSHDGKTAWVHNAFDHSVSRLERKDDIVQVVHTAAFTTDTLPVNVVEGRKLFFTAIDSRMTSLSTGIACASCHLEGREDGHVWNFSDGPRQTPSLAGRLTTQTLPLHWNGEFDGLTSFMAQTVNHRMGGSGATMAMEEQIKAFIDFQPAPDNPHKLSTLTDAQQRGAVVFQLATCSTCHLGQALTDNGFHFVGTEVLTATSAMPADNHASLIHDGFNTPSLMGLARSAPYLHDGSAATLMDRVNNDENGAHGKTSTLTNDQKADLVEYLKTL